MLLHRITTGVVALSFVVASTTAQAATSTTPYPTTVTSIWSTAITSIATAAIGVSSTAAETVVTVRTVTLLDPWPVSPDPYLYPYTILETSIVRDVVDHQGSTTTTASTAYPTWLVWDTQAADMPVGNSPHCEVTDTGGSCAPRAWKPDTRCLALGQETRCHEQCIIREWQWWCQRGTTNNQSQSDTGLPMGRLCWGNANNYTQLVEPCDDTDYPPECPVCPVTK